MTDPTEIDTFDVRNNGFQAMSRTLRIACAECFGNAANTSTLAPEDFSVVNWLSMVASVAS